MHRKREREKRKMDLYGPVAPVCTGAELAIAVSSELKWLHMAMRFDALMRMHPEVQARIFSNRTYAHNILLVSKSTQHVFDAAPSLAAYIEVVRRDFLSKGTE